MRMSLTLHMEHSTNKETFATICWDKRAFSYRESSRSEDISAITLRVYSRTVLDTVSSMHRWAHGNVSEYDCPKLRNDAGL